MFTIVFLTPLYSVILGKEPKFQRTEKQIPLSIISLSLTKVPLSFPTTPLFLLLSEEKEKAVRKEQKDLSSSLVASARFLTSRYYLTSLNLLMCNVEVTIVLISQIIAKNK